MLALSLLLCIGAVSVSARDGCHGDNCANHVTGSFYAIGLPLSSRISLCESYLESTITPRPRTITTTVTNTLGRGDGNGGGSGDGGGDASCLTYASAMDKPASVSESQAKTTFTPANAKAVPDFATAQCSPASRFSSACACWTDVEQRTITAHRPTRTTTITTWVSGDHQSTGNDFSTSNDNPYPTIGQPPSSSTSTGRSRPSPCGPAATAVSSSTRFKCSHHNGMCSCLRGGPRGGANVCVNVGGNWFDRRDHRDDGEDTGPNRGPCDRAKECDVHGRCEDEGTVCVWDDSCDCGKRRCYVEVRNGCDFQDSSAMSPDV